MGSLYRHNNLFDQAVVYYKEAYEIFVKLNDKTNMGLVLNNIGGCYLQIGNLKDSLDYFLKGTE